MKKKLPAVLSIIALFGLFVPLIRQKVALFYVPDLAGVVMKDTLKVSGSWWNRGFQERLEKKSKESLNVYPSCIRIRNRFEYTFFNKLNAQGFYVYNDVFYRMSYMKYNERNSFVGFEKIQSQVRSLKRFQEYLKTKDIPVYVVFAASKFRLYRDQLPWWNKTGTENTNLIQYKKALSKAGINVIDANEWFEQLNAVRESSLMSRHGVHWSLYGASLVYDSLIKRVGQEKNTDLQRVSMKIVPGKNTSESDNDGVRTSNLFYPPTDRSLKETTFPEIRNPKRKMRPFVLGDSFFGVIAWSGLNRQVIADSSYFYYYFRERQGLKVGCDPKFTESDIENDLRRSDCFIMVIDLQNLDKFGFGFIEEYIDRKGF